MVTHSSPVPPHLISICQWFSARKTSNEATNVSYHLYMLAGSSIWGTICTYQNETPKVPINAFDIGEVWNPACCHGNQTVALIFWSNSRILLSRIKHFWYKLAEMYYSLVILALRKQRDCEVTRNTHRCALNETFFRLTQTKHTCMKTTQTKNKYQT